MNIFKKLFFKQDKEQSLEFDGLKAYIIIGVDNEGDNFVACDFEEDQQERISELLFLLISGGVVDKAIQSVQEACENEKEAEKIYHDLALLIAMQSQQAQQANDEPVVDPLEVFSRGDKNEFKG